jgi:predicted O-linked N-acetylglucosamine transferase (SPINDLY family)
VKPNSIQKQLERAAALHRGGDLAAAAALYEKLIAKRPREWQPLFLMAVLRYQQRRHADARQALERVVALNAKHADAWFYLGEVYCATGQHADGATAFARATMLSPDNALAWFGLGVAREGCGEVDLARTAYARALELRPEFPEALNNLAVLRRAAGEIDEAETLLRKAVSQNPAFGAAAVNLAALLTGERQDPRGAVEILRAAIEALPADAGLRFELGLTYTRLGRPGDARAAYEDAIRLDPCHADALTNLGVLHFDASAYAEAEDCYRRALAVRPEQVEAWNNLGNLLLRLERLDEARLAFESALRLRPRMEEALTGLGAVLNDQGDLRRAADVLTDAVAAHSRSFTCIAMLGNVLQRLGRLDEARALYDRALEIRAHPGLKIKRALMLSAIPASVDSLEAERARLEQEVDALIAGGLSASEAELLEFPDTCFFLAYHGRNERDLLRKVATLYLSACPELGYTAAHSLEGPGAGPIRIGFVSRFLYSHAVGRFFDPVIEALARDPAFHVTVFTLGARDDQQLRQLRSACQQHVELPSTSLAQARKRIERERLDVLVYPEIGMDPFTYLLSFARLARVQCVLHGHSVTSGVPNQDCFVSSALLEPPEGEAQYTERLVRLPTLPMYLEPPALPAAPRTREALGLPAQGTLYLCPMKLQKVHPEMDPAIAAILERHADAQIVFIQDDQNPSWHAQLRDRLGRAVGPHAARVHFVPYRRTLAEFLEVVQSADVILDTFHHGGATTAHFCLAAGKPMVSWITDTCRTRATAAYYELLGIEGCTATTRDAYVELAVRLGTDRTARAAMASRIRSALPRLYRNEEVFSAYAAFLKAEAARHRVSVPLPYPYRRLAPVEAWCRRNGLPRYTVEPETVVQVPAPRIFGEPWSEVTARVEVPPVGVAELHEVDVIGQESLVVAARDGSVIYDLPFQFPDNRVEVTGGALRHKLGEQVLVRSGPRAAEDIECGVLLCGRATLNYYHWLFEYLPKLRILDAAPQYRDWPLLVDAGLHTNLQACLERLNVHRRPVIEVEKGVWQRVRRLAVPESGVRMPLDYRPGATVYADDIVFSPHALDYLRAQLRVEVSAAGRGRRIYIRRGHMRQRRLLNEAEVEAAFIAHGFDSVSPETMTLEEQIALFSTAQVIAGPTGAGMANMVFAPRGCRVMVLHYGGVPFFSFSTLAATLGHSLLYVLGTPDRNSHSIWYQCDFSVEPEKISRALGALEALPAAASVAVAPPTSRGHDDAERSLDRRLPRFGFLTHTPELFHHYRAVWRALPQGSFDVVTAGDQSAQAQIAQLASAEGVACVALTERARSGLRYDCLVSNDSLDPDRSMPLIRRLGKINVRLMHSLGKAGWSLGDWNRLYDVILCFGPHHREALAAVTDAAIVEVGYPRFDGFFGLLARRREILEGLGCDPRRRTIVWLPTREGLSSVDCHGATVADLARECNVIVKPHPRMAREEPERVKALAELGPLRVLTDSSDNVPLYAAADFVLCDYGDAPFGAIHADRNLLLLDVPGAEHDPSLGQNSPELLIREVIPHVAPGDVAALRVCLQDDGLWDSQRQVRRELRAALFAPHVGYAGTVAAHALLHADLIAAARQPQW